MSIQPTQPVMDFDALVDLLNDRIEEYRGVQYAAKYGLIAMPADALAKAAWGIHNAAAEIGKATP